MIYRPAASVACANRTAGRKDIYEEADALRTALVRALERIEELEEQLGDET